MNTVATVDLAPALELLAIASLIAATVLALWWWRVRRTAPLARHVALAALTMFVTADLIVFGSFTRLTDSGLGCPDWPGCYGQSSPWHAAAPIASAERALPSGPVTLSKAWIEMIHRYLAMTVGALILVLTVVLWRARAALGRAPWWVTAALAWVVVQGLFGKYTVTLRLYPAVVTAHLLGGMVLLALLAAQLQSLRRVPPLPVARTLVLGVLVLLALQIALGGWVSSNYAVLACRGFPQCNDQWWPEADFAQGFALLRELGRSAGGYVEFKALVAIQLVHRIAALLVTAAVVALAACLWRSGQHVDRRAAVWLLSLLAVQVGSGLSNVLLDWPLVAALLHTAGAAALVAVLTTLACRRPRPASATQPVPEAGLLRHRA